MLLERWCRSAILPGAVAGSATAPSAGRHPVASLCADGPLRRVRVEHGSRADAAPLPSSPHTDTGWIRGWRLTFGAEEYGWEGALATLVPDDDTGPGVFVALYDLTDADERTLDAWEGADPASTSGCTCG